MTRDEYSVVVEVDEEPRSDRPELEFQDFSSTSNVDGKIGSAKQQQPSSNGGSGGGGFSDPFYDPQQATQQREASGASGASAPIWSVEYYAQFFDVNTDQVVDRMAKSLFPKENFTEFVGPNPDLYGPFWIATTVAFLLFVTSSLAGSIAAFLSDYEYTFDFSILSFGAVTIYSYAFIVPFMVWAVLKYIGCKPTLLDTICLYGYGLTVWIPISVVCIVHSDILRWTSVLVGFSISGAFLVRNLYPIISRAEAKPARIVIIFIVAAHAGLALLVKVWFFSYVINPPKGGKGGSGNDSNGKL